MILTMIMSFSYIIRPIMKTAAIILLSVILFSSFTPVKFVHAHMDDSASASLVTFDVCHESDGSIINNPEITFLCEFPYIPEVSVFAVLYELPESASNSFMMAFPIEYPPQA